MELSCESIGVFFEKSDFLFRPSFLLLQSHSNGVNNMDFIPKIRILYPKIKIILLYREEVNLEIQQAINYGINGAFDLNSPLPSLWIALSNSENQEQFLIGSLSDYAKNVNSIEKHISEIPFTPQEGRIVYLLLQGYSYSMIANEIIISLNTVREHIRNIYKKVNIHSKEGLFNLFISKNDI